MEAIRRILGVREVNDPGVYLGLPTIWGRSKKAALSFIRDRIKKKLEGWKANTLSLARKETLLKAVATAIPTYSMMCFRYPANLCKEINGDIAKFWWGNAMDESKIHWKSWHSLCRGKVSG